MVFLGMRKAPMHADCPSYHLTSRMQYKRMGVGMRTRLGMCTAISRPRDNLGNRLFDAGFAFVSLFVGYGTRHIQRLDEHEIMI